MWRKLQPELLKKIVSVPEYVRTNNDTNAINLKAPHDGRIEKERGCAGNQDELAVAVTVVRYFTRRQVKILRNKKQRGNLEPNYL